MNNNNHDWEPFSIDTERLAKYGHKEETKQKQLLTFTLFLNTQEYLCVRQWWNIMIA